MDRRQPGQLRPMTVTPSLTAQRARAAAALAAIPAPRGGSGPTPSPIASPAAGFPRVLTAARSAPTGVATTTGSAAAGATRPGGRRGRHAAPPRRRDRSGSRVVLTAAVALALGSAGTMLAQPSLETATPSAAALPAVGS